MQKTNTSILFSLFSILLLISCEQIEKTRAAVNTAEEYAQKIMDGDILPTDSEENLAFLQGLTSLDSAQRIKAFDYYLQLNKYSNGTLGGLLTGHIKNYFLEHPQEFLHLFKLLSDEQQSKIIDDLSYEFYASGLEGKNDILPFIKETLQKCKSCDAATVENIYTQIIEQYMEVNAE